MRAGIKSALAALALLTCGACGGAQNGANTPGSGRTRLPDAVVEATREEAKGDPARAVALWLDVVDAAVSTPDDPWALAAEQAALDALVSRSIPAMADLSDDVALVYRTRDSSLASGAGDRAGIAGRLAAAAARATDPFSAGLVTRALHEVATHRGDAGEAEKWRAATGCASTAAVVGPLAWTAVTGVKEDDPIARQGAKLEASYPTHGAFPRAMTPVIVGERGCAIDPTMVATSGGVRDVIVDVTVDQPQRIGVVLRARSAAVLRAGGRVVADRAYALGGEESARFARIDVARAGTLRLVARIGMDDDGEAVEIDVFGEHGKPLATRAPRPGEAGTAVIAQTAATTGAVTWPPAKTDSERAALAFAALAAGERPVAEEATAGEIAREGVAPELVLAYARAIEAATDLDAVHKSERARGAYERVLDAWPGAWEAIAAHASLAGVRRGQSEQRIWTLRDLDDHRTKAGAAVASGAVLDALDAAIAGRDHLMDRANAALGRAKQALPGSPLVRDAEGSVVDRTGAERVAYECAIDPATDRGRLDCYDALRAAGDRTKAGVELERVRALYGASHAYLSLELRAAVAAGDMAAATRAYDAMMPGERTLAALYAVKPGPDVQSALTALAPIVRDAPVGLPPLFRASGDDAIAPFAGIAEKVTAEDRAKPILPSAATAVLAHAERYDVTKDGLVRFVLFDVRRVSGTTDVEENAQAEPPGVTGRTTMRIVRRRIFKKDGRVVEPARTPGASQAHADLSQLEQGDTVEAIYEGWALPSDNGNITIDTPDLLPDRTAVHEGSIEVRTPASLAASLWSHPLLGKAAESREGSTRVLRWTVKDTGQRRLEDGTPKMDRDVGVSLSTATWADTARALRETLASLEDAGGDVRAWALTAAAGKTKPREIVDAVVEAAGRSVKEAGASALSDIEIGRPPGSQTTTARTILTNHEGSRTWLIVRGLRELGIGSEVAIAENEPFSAVADFPPHDGRFTHPLAIAHVKEGDGAAAKTSDVWIDADVAGPPLPAGRVSPELRGRAVLHEDGRVDSVPAGGSNDERDEVDVRLTVDARGDAKGSLTILLRGRTAQELAEALVRIVGDERQRMLRGVALGWIPYADVDDVVLSSTEESWQVAIRAALTIPGFAQAEGAASGSGKTWVLQGVNPIHAVFPRPMVATLGATYASQGARKDALAVNRALQYHLHRRVELPQGAVVSRAPGSVDVKGPILTAQRRMAVAANVVEDDFTLSITTGTVGPEAYGAFAGDAHKVDDGFLASTRVKPEP